MAFGFDDAMLAMAGAQLVGGLIGSDASKSASNAQVSSANRATDAQLQMFDTVRGDQAPYRQIGSAAISQLGLGLGIPGYKNPNGPVMSHGQTFGSKSALNDALYSDFLSKVGGDASKVSQEAIDKVTAQATPVDDSSNPNPDPNAGYFTHQFGANDLNASLAPNWQFALQQGQGAAANALNLHSGTGGNFAKGIVDYTLNKSGDLYQQAYQNYTNNQTNIYNRLASIAGLGQTAGSAGTTGAPQFSAGIAGTTQAAGAAQAAGIVGSTNALTGGINNAASWYSLPSIMKMGRTQENPIG